MENLTIGQVLAFFGVSSGTVAGISWAMIKLFVKEEALKATQPKFDDLDARLKELKDDNKESMEDLKRLIGKLFDKFDALDAKWFDFIVNCSGKTEKR